MQLVDLKCAQCGAALPPHPEGGVYRCGYCGHAYEPVPDPEPAPRVLQIEIHAPFAAAAPMAPARFQTARSSGGARGVGCLVPILVAAGIFVYFQTQRSPLTPVQVAARPASASFFPSHERSFWDSVGGAPQGITISGAPAIVGRMRMGSDDQLYVVAIRPSDLTLAWRYGPLGSYSQGYQATKFAVTGDRVVVSDYRSAVHILDAKSGTETSQARLTDRVERMCAAGPSSVWIGTVDKHGTLLDTRTGTTREGARPATGCEDEWSMRTKKTGKDAPKVAGFAARRTLVDGDIGVAGGGKSPGTEIPMAVGYDPKSGAQRWVTVLPTTDPSLVRAHSNTHDALATGIYVTNWGTGSKGWHISALEPRSGARLWDTELPKIFAVDSIDGIVASGGFVYVTRTSSLAILNGTNGKLVGAVGDETYDTK